MSKTSKSHRKVLVTAWHAGKAVFAEYVHRFSPKLFTRPQLFACNVLRVFLRLDFRGAEQFLRDSPDLCQAIGLTRVPDHTTLYRAAQRQMKSVPSMALLAVTARAALGRRRHIALAAVDSSGFEATHASRYFVQRRSKNAEEKQPMTYRRYGKLMALVDTASHVVIGMETSRGPTPDIDQLGSVLARRVPGLVIHHLLGDAGFDSEANHRLLREEHGIISTFPAKHGRRSDKPPAGHYRRKMRARFNKRSYGQRAQIETVFSMIKRNLGGTLGARGYWSRCREMTLRVITHNIMIQLRSGSFATEPVKS